VSAERQIKPPPPNFCLNFVRGGWRAVERMYGSRTSTIVNWYHICGGPTLGTMGRRYQSGDMSVLEQAAAMDVERRGVE
jgi:hypothetical protein